MKGTRRTQGRDTATRCSRLCLGLALAVALTAVPAQAEAPTTRCTFQGIAPGFRAMRLDLPDGSDFLTLQLHSDRRTRPLNDESNWHLAEGIVVVDAATLEVAAHHVQYSGTAAPVIVAELDGERVARQPATAPDGPWVHSARRSRSGLPPGSYYVVAFGTGGPSEGALAQWWSSSVYVEGSHTCQAAVDGETFDYDHTEFSGGTQVYAAGAGSAEDITLELMTDRPLVVGLMDAGAQGQAVSTVSLAYELPSISGSLERGIAPFVSQAGTHTFTADYRGAYPIIGISGAALEVPGA